MTRNVSAFGGRKGNKRQEQGTSEIKESSQVIQTDDKLIWERK